LRDPQFEKDFERSTSHFRLLMFYLQNPATATRVFHNGANWGAFQRFPGFANLPKAPGREPGTPSRAFSLWTDFKQFLFFTHPVIYVLYAIVLSVLLIALLGWRGGNPNSAVAGAMILIVCAFLELGFSTLADTGETHRHLYLYNRMLDALVLAVAAALISRSRLFSRKPVE
jgi:hypothetical protein